MYCSRMSSDGVVGEVAGIVKRARGFNAVHQISGMLVFDGENFCQYIEGPAPALSDLVEHIRRDPRHREVHDLIPEERLTGERVFDNWSMAYQFVDDGLGLERFFQSNGENALGFLRNLLPELDRA